MNWQPIETVPKNTPILVSDGTYVVAVVMDADFFKPEQRLRICPYGFSGYEWEWEFDDNEITYWMPLPEPPKEIDYDTTSLPSMA